MKYLQSLEKAFFNMKNIDFHYLKKPINFSVKHEYLFKKVWEKKIGLKKVETIKKAKVYNDGTILNAFEIHPVSFFAKKYNSLNFIYHLKLIIKPSKETINIAAWTTDSWGAGYFHWFVDTLQRYIMCLNEDKNAILLIPEHFKHISYITASLKLFNFSHKFISNNSPILINILLIPPFIKPRGTFIRESIYQLRQLALSTLKDNIDFKYLYISRKKARIRHVENELEVIDLMNKLNILVVFLEDLIWEKQFELFCQCKLLISLHGAGLTNMLFMPNDSKIIEIKMKGSDDQVCYYEMASILEFKYYYLLANPATETDHPHDGNCFVDIKKLKTLCETIQTSF